METFRWGAHRFGLQKKVTLRDGETIVLWSSADAVVIKVLTGIVQVKLQPPPQPGLLSSERPY